MTRVLVGVLLLLSTACGACAGELDVSGRHLARADANFRTGRAGAALVEYRTFLGGCPHHPRADYAIYMVGESCRLAASEMLVPPYMFLELSPRQEPDSRTLANYLAATYGMYADMSEGDGYWRYDMRAYRELLKRYPRSQYADDCRFLLAQARPHRGWSIGSGPPVAQIARGLIRDYQAILRDFPRTNRRAEITKAISELREIERRNSARPARRRPPG